MNIDRRILLAEALELTRADDAKVRTRVDDICLEERFIAEFVVESEALEGYKTTTSEVLDSVRDLVLGLTPTAPGNHSDSPGRSESVGP